jgi:diguanylate cyclase (GGDEF)-like protein
MKPPPAAPAVQARAADAAFRSCSRVSQWGDDVLSAIHRYLSRLPAAGVFVLALLALGLVGVADYLTGPETSVVFLYLVPVAFGTWYGSRTYGFVLTLLSALTAIATDLASGQPYSHTVIPFWNGLLQFIFSMIGVGLLDMLRERLHLEQKLARTDALTGILNSRAFVEHMGYIIALSRRDGAPITLAYIDLDDFKQVNDTRGRSAGDKVLRIVGHTLRTSIRRTDAVARLGGDEFALLLPVTNQEAARTLIGKIKLRLTEALALHSFPVGCSIGAVTFRAPPANADEAIRIADRVMYQAKSQGKNAIVFQTVPPAA